MSLTQKVAHNTLIQFAGKALSILIGVFTIAIMTRYLGSFGFGQYSTITAYLQFFGILVDMGLSLTIVKLITDPKNDQTEIVNNVFSLRFFSALIFLGLAPLVVLFFPYDNLIKIGVAVTSLSFLASSLTIILIGLFQKELKMNRVTIAEVSGRLVLFTCVAVSAWLNLGLIAIMVATVLGSLTNFLLTYLFSLRYVKISFAFDWRIWKKIIGVTWPIAISIAFNLVYFKADTIILSLVRTQTEVGIYNAPYRILEILTNFIYMYLGIIFPILSYNWLQKNYDKFKSIFQRVFDSLIIISLPMVCGTFFIAEKLIAAVAGPEFSDSAIVLKIIIFATAIIFINSLFGYTIVIIGKQKQLVWAYVITAVVSLIGYLLTIPIYGYYGAATFTIISETMILTFNVVVTLRTIKFSPSLLIILKSAVASIIMSLFLYFLPNLNLILQLIFASIIYFIALYLLKGFPKELVMEIIKIKPSPEVSKIDNI
jgi:O-antigen/teichoic acid export membrane protein